MKLPPPTIIIDTREQTPWRFPADQPVERATLASGDYSLAGYETRVAIERKSLPDFVACCGRERARFEAELLRLAAYESAAVIIEAPEEAAERHEYRSMMLPQSVITSALAFMQDYRLAVWWAGNAARGAWICRWWLSRWLRKLNERAGKELEATG